MLEKQITDNQIVTDECSDLAAEKVPRISVVVPVRNAASALSESIRHLLESSIPFELIVVDDASTDSSPQVAAASGARVVALDHQSGPAVARNRGLAVATTEYVAFVDSDVCVQENTLVSFVELLDKEPQVAAAFGSYDAQPAARNFISQYKNLFHHYVHQKGNPNASTFWAGCGVVRKEVFLAGGGFDESYRRPCIEDIEFGVRLVKAGGKIRLDRSIQVTHHKHWTPSGLLKCELFDRGIPWTRLLLRERELPNDLNLGLTQRLAAVLTLVALACYGAQAILQPTLLGLPVLLLIAMLLLDYSTAHARSGHLAKLVAAITILASLILPCFGTTPSLGIVALALLASVAAINMQLLLFFARIRGLLFAVCTFPMLVAYYAYSLAAVAAGTMLHMLQRPSRVETTIRCENSGQS